MNEQAARQLVTLRAHSRCEGCRCHVGDSFSHRVRRGQGGLWVPSNGTRLCGHGTAGCHGDVTAMPALAVELGICLESWQDPLTEPAYLHTVNGTGWWLLDDEGGYTWVDPLEVSESKRQAATAWDRRTDHGGSPSPFR